MSPQGIAEFRYRLLQNVLRQTIPHDGNRGGAQRGAAEAQFGTYLNRYFPGKIHAGLTLNISNFPHPYTPDFAYIDQGLNLYIDIEIDEPYVYHSGEPTHYVGADKDNRRNNHFINKGWIVIRFSEEQVVCHPHSCCKSIASAIVKITGDNSLLNQFVNVLNLQPIRQWTEHEATVMAQRKARDNYQCRSTFNSLMPITINQTCHSDFLKANNLHTKNNILLPIQVSKTNISTQRKKIKHKFTRYLSYQPIGINIENCKKSFLNSLETQPTVLGEWVKNNRTKAETFLKDWNH
jgi:hypothetical protein